MPTLENIHSVAALGWTSLTVPKSSFSEEESLFFTFKDANEFSEQCPL